MPLALSRLLLIMSSGPAGPLVHPHGVLTPRRESHGRDRFWPSLRPLLLPPRLPRWHPSRPAATALSLRKFPFEDFHPPLTSRPPQRPTWMPLALLPNYSSEIPPRAIRTLTGGWNIRPSLRTTPPCATLFLAGHHRCQPTFCRVFLRISTPPFRRLRSLLAKAGYTPPTTASSSSSVNRRRNPVRLPAPDGTRGPSVE